MTRYSVCQGYTHSSTRPAAPAVVGRGLRRLLPCHAGCQARREFYVIMCRCGTCLASSCSTRRRSRQSCARSGLNKGRLPGLVRYIVDNRDDYVFSALTASVDGTMGFVGSREEGHGNRLGVLHVAMDARFLINDGQHRRKPPSRRR